MTDAAVFPANLLTAESAWPWLHPRLVRIKEQPPLCSCSLTPVSLIRWNSNLSQTLWLCRKAGSPAWAQPGLLQSPTPISKCPSSLWHLQSGAYVGETQRLPPCLGLLCYFHHFGRWPQAPKQMGNQGASPAEPAALPAPSSSQVAPVQGWNWSYHGESASTKWPPWRFPAYKISGGCGKVNCNANFLTGLQCCDYIRCWALLVAGAVASLSATGNPALSRQ